MSLNQSRSERSDSGQHRKTGRSGTSGHQRGFAGSAGPGKGGGGGVSTGPPPIISAPTLSSNRNPRKSNHNAQGAQSRSSGTGVISDATNASAVPRTVQNGAHVQPPLHGVSDAPASSFAANQKTTQSAPKDPSSHPTAVSSEMTAPTTPAKAPGDGSKGFPFQFGSLSPGLMNGMQIPARTSSAPPNLDEQKRDQARSDSYRAAPTIPIPPIPKQQLPRKDVGAADQSNSGEAYPPSKSKREAQVPSVSPVTQQPKPSVHAFSGMSMQLPFHQSQLPVQFGGPNPQIQPQGMTMPMPMPIPMGSAPQVQQPMFVPGLQHPSMQPPGIMAQGQGMSFTAQMGPQLPPQLGNLGINISGQYPPQQAGKYASTRKPIKITHPDTHEELRLDKRAETYVDVGSSGSRSHTSAPPQSQPIQSFQPAHYFSNSYNANPFFMPSGSVPLASTQIAPNSQTSKYNYLVSQGPPSGSYMNQPPLNSLSASKAGTQKHSFSEPMSLEPAVSSSTSSGTVPVTVKPANAPVGGNIAYSSLPTGAPAVEKSESMRLTKPPEEGCKIHPQRDSRHESLASVSLPLASKQSALASPAVSVESPTSSALSSAPSATSILIEDSASNLTNSEGRKKETLSRANSIKDNQKKVGKKGYLHSQQVSVSSTSVSSLSPQVCVSSTSVLSLPSQAFEHSTTTNVVASESEEAKTVHAPLKSNDDVLGSCDEQPIVCPTASDASELKSDSAGSVCKSCEISGAGIIDAVESVHAKRDGLSSQNEQKYGTVEKLEQEEIKLPEEPKKNNNSGIPLESVSSRSSDIINQSDWNTALNVTSSGSEVGSLEVEHEETEEPVLCHTEVNSAGGSSSLDASSSGSSVGNREVVVEKSGISDQGSATVQTPCPSEAAWKHERDGKETMSGVQVSLPVSGSKDKPTLEQNRSKSCTAKGKKKKKEILQKADAAGTNFDLYMAYKGPEEKKETVIPLENTESATGTNLKQAPADLAQEIIEIERGGQSKSEPDDWEDAADISTPKLESSNNKELVQDGNGLTAKKYSRDFLLKFSEQCMTLPEDFKVTPDIEALITNVNGFPIVDRESYPSPTRIIDRSSGGSRLDRRGSGIVDDDKWSKVPGSFASGRDVRMDIGYGGNVVGFRPGQGGNYGVLRNPRGQTSVQYAGGILSGPVQSLGPQGGMQRMNPDAERWQRATGFQKGLIPSPQTPLQVMHKAEKKYEVGKVTDVEEAKQRQLKGILNKLTPQNFEKLFEQVKAVNIDNAETLTGVISQIFDKALMEPTFCEMYANFCSHLAGELPDFNEGDEKITFRRVLLNKCQEEFERGEREQEEANRVEEEGEIQQSEEEREEKRIKARRRMLGNIRLIGELYKKKMLTERIMHSCINKLLGFDQAPDEEDVEALCKLMSTIGEMIDHLKAKEFMDHYFEKMTVLSNKNELSSRVRFMLKDAIDLRKNKWQQRRKVEGPKKIEEVHRDAAQERQAQASRLARGPGINSSTRRAQPMDFGPRGSSMLPSPNSQTVGYRGLPTHVRGGFGAQDVRLDDRAQDRVPSYEGRPLSVPLPQRPVGDESITLGPQGGLARGMSIRGHPSMSSAGSADISSNSGDSRRMPSGLNGYNSVPERTAYGSREDSIPRYMPERLSPSAYDQSSAQESNLPYGSRDIRNPDRNADRSHASSPSTCGQGTQNVSSEKVWPEEQLRDKSIYAIKEFYSAKDEKEVASCIRDLNAPSFYPSMISIWVTDSFERKDMERDLLAKLLVNLTKSRDGMLNQVQLIKGFESVLTTLEDAVNDAPRAAEFLGHIFGKIILENAVTLREIGQLIHEGGEEPGHLLEIGLAGDVFGSTLEMIKSVKGETVLSELLRSSNLQLEDFSPPDPLKSKKLEMFISGQ